MNEGQQHSHTHFSLNTLESSRWFPFWGPAQEELGWGWGTTLCSPQGASPQEPWSSSIFLASHYPWATHPGGVDHKGRRDWSKREERSRGQLRSEASREGSGIPLGQIQVLLGLGSLQFRRPSLRKGIQDYKYKIYIAQVNVYLTREKKT